MLFRSPTEHTRDLHPLFPEGLIGVSSSLHVQAAVRRHGLEGHTETHPEYGTLCEVTDLLLTVWGAGGSTPRARAHSSVDMSTESVLPRPAQQVQKCCQLLTTQRLRCSTC